MLVHINNRKSLFACVGNAKNTPNTFSLKLDQVFIFIPVQTFVEV